MDLILASPQRKELGVIRYPVFDCDCNGQRNFSLSVPVSEWDGSITFGSRIFVPGEEYGGIVGQITTDTDLALVTVSGYTWRGLLAQKVISPAQGEDYVTVSGDANAILSDLIDQRFSNQLVANSETSGITISSYQYKRYCTLLDGLNDMLADAGARLSLVYDDETARVIVSAVPAVDYSPDIELSQDYDLQFTYDDIRNRPNHLIVGGKGELAARQILHLYADRNGNIGKTQRLFGLDEIEVFWENTSTDQLEKEARKHFEEIKNAAKLSMDINSIPDSARIGDIVGGRDYITGQSMKAPIGNLVLQINGDTITKNYTLEEAKK